MKKILGEIQDGTFAKEFIANVAELPARREVQKSIK
jgi:ketol-acid reductoisomerase